MGSLGGRGRSFQQERCGQERAGRFCSSPKRRFFGAGEVLFVEPACNAGAERMEEVAQGGICFAAPDFEKNVHRDGIVAKHGLAFGRENVSLFGGQLSAEASAAAKHQNPGGRAGS